jgi:hypothetical protein
MIAELMILLALVAQPGGVKKQPLHPIDGASVELPEIRRQQPRPADAAFLPESDPS